MTYAETLDFLYSQLPMFHRTGAAAYKAGLDNTLALDQYFNHPHHQFKTIHVAGTNGKGSVSHTLASVLTKAGFKTGLYTSPHLVDFRERIRINGQMISEHEVTSFIEKHQEIIREIKPSFFEMTVALAFDYFAHEKVDVAVIEVGLGGRLDSTNIINPLVTVITNIGYDHMQFLGDTLLEIAGEKAGIIKPGVPVVIGETHEETAQVFIDRSNQLNAPVFFADQLLKLTHSENRNNGIQSFTILKNGETEIQNLEIDLAGFYQKRNILTIFQTLEILKASLSISDEAIMEGVRVASRSTGLQGRWQTIAQNPLTICDTGHNQEGIEMVLEQIKATSFNHLHMVFGMVSDKEVEKILKMLPKNASYYFTRASIPRALDENELLLKSIAFGLYGQAYKTVPEAVLSAREKALPGDLVFIGGSTFVVADILTWLQDNHF